MQKQHTHVINCTVARLQPHKLIVIYYILRESQTTQNVLWSRASVCLSVRGCTPTLLHGPGCNLGAWYRLPPSCALLGGFAIGARVALLWQHNANPSYKLASIPRYDDIVRTAAWVGSARAAVRRPEGAPQNRAPHAGSGRGRSAGDRPPTGAFSTLLRQSGLLASTGGVLATKSKRKMLASTCLYSLYAWLN